MIVTRQCQFLDFNSCTMVMQKKIQKIHMNVLREDRKSIGNLLSNDSEGRAVLRLQFFCKFDIVSNLCYLSDEKIRKTDKDCIIKNSACHAKEFKCHSKNY